jgi:hypothetical protein
MNEIRNHLHRFTAAMSHLTGFPRDGDDEVALESGSLPHFAVVGLAIAAASLLVIRVAAVTDNGIATAVLSTILVTVLWTVLNRCRPLRSLGVIIQHCISILQDDDDMDGDVYDNIATPALTLFLILKLALLGILLKAGEFSWVAMVPLASVLFAVETAISCEIFREPERKHHMIFLAIIAGGALVFGGAGGLFAALFIWLLAHSIGFWTEGPLGDIDEEHLINAGMEVAEIGVLLLGILVVLR